MNKSTIVKGHSLLGRNRVIFNYNGQLYTGTLMGIENGVTYVKSKGSKKMLEFNETDTILEYNKDLPKLKPNQLFIMPPMYGNKLKEALNNASENTPNVFWEPEKDILSN